MIAWLARSSMGAAAIATFLSSGWALTQSPFAAPYVDRTTTEIGVALTHALDRSLTSDSATRAISDALSRGEADEAGAVLRLADGRGVAVSDNLRARVVAAEETAAGWSACLACAVDPDACPDLTRVAACNLPLELTPVGDLNAVRRALVDYVAGDEIDRVDLSLGVVGLAATAAVLGSGGSSVTVKAGATALRVARRAGAVSGAFMDDITVLATRALRLDRAGEVISGGARFEDLIEPVAAGRLAAAAADVGRLTDKMPLGDAFALLKRADGTEDLARIVRVADTAGPETRGAFALLGTSRVLRLTHRVSDLALFTLAAIAAFLGQVSAFALWLLRRLVPRPARRAGSVALSRPELRKRRGQ